MSHPDDRSHIPPAVTVVVLNWNGWCDTVACLASLQDCSYPNLSIIVADNGSTDGSVEHIRERFPSVQVLENYANLGFATGNNPAIRKAMADGAKYIWLLNNDTVVSKKALSSMVEVAESHERIGGVGSLLLEADKQENVQAWGGGRVGLLSGLVYPQRSKLRDGALHYLCAASLLLRSDALRSIGLLDESFFMYWEDTDLGFRLRKGGWKLKVAEQARVLHREHASSGKSTLVLAEMFHASSVRFFKRHSRVPMIPILVGGLLRASKQLVQGKHAMTVAIIRQIASSLWE